MIEHTCFYSDIPNNAEISFETFSDRDRWLEARTHTIGGSDASSIVGLNPYKSNIQLYEEKVGKAIPTDISEVAYVKYGNDAEPFLRELFALDYPQYRVGWKPNTIMYNRNHPFAHYSADGFLFDNNTMRFGLLEIKTTNILQSIQKESWKDRIPDNYYIQCLHGMMVCNAEFVILKAQLKSEFEGEVYLQTKHYRIERADVLEDIEYLKEKETEFWQNIQEHKRPSLILPTL